MFKYKHISICYLNWAYVTLCVCRSLRFQYLDQPKPEKAQFVHFIYNGGWQRWVNISNCPRVPGRQPADFWSGYPWLPESIDKKLYLKKKGSAQNPAFCAGLFGYWDKKVQKILFSFTFIFLQFSDHFFFQAIHIGWNVLRDLYCLFMADSRKVKVSFLKSSDLTVCGQMLAQIKYKACL